MSTNRETVAEIWQRHDGWQITVTQRDPLVCSHIPMTNRTLAAGVATYPILVAAMEAHGYSRRGEVSE